MPLFKGAARPKPRDFWENRPLPPGATAVYNPKTSRELFKPKVYFAKDLRWDTEDLVNSMPLPYSRLAPMLIPIFKANIMMGSNDEPNAPRIDVINNFTSQPVPRMEFHYSNRIWHGDNVPPPDLDNLVGCDCEDECDPMSTTCSCLKRQHELAPGLKGFAYQDNGRLKKASLGWWLRHVS
jgi:[histone H3]-lysine9 N-trimethyltransferase SUV39H